MRTTIPDIDSSGWALDPRRYGMSAGDYIQSASRAVFHEFLARAPLNRFFHFEGLCGAANCSTIFPNLDTIYSIAIVNARNGLVLMLPEVGQRYLSVQVVTEDHLTPFCRYGGGRHEFFSPDFDTDFVAVRVCIGTDGTAEDVRRIVEELQPQYFIEGASLENDLTPVDRSLLECVRAALMQGYSALPNTSGIMQRRAADVRDWEAFTYATAGAWGFPADEYLMFAGGGPVDAGGEECYVATFPPVPAGAFFSVTAYGPEKYPMTDEDNVVGSQHGVRLEADGSFRIAFGGERCRSLAPNFLATPQDGWSILIRAYRPEVAAFRAYAMPEIVRV